MDPKQKLRPGALPQLLGYRLRLAQQAVFRDYAASVHGLSPGRVGLLVYVDANPGVTQSRLAEAAERDRSTMVGVLDLLEGRGLIERLGRSAFVRKFSVQFVQPSGRVSQPFYFFTRYGADVAQTWQVLRSERH